MNNTTKSAQFTLGPWVVNTFIVNGQHKLEVLDATDYQARVAKFDSCIVTFDGTSKKVKNLGWLLRYWQEVDYIRITKLKDGGCWMIAFMKHPIRDGAFYYFSTWQSWELCVRWINLPVLRGLPLVIQQFDYKRMAPRVETISTC